MPTSKLTHVPRPVLVKLVTTKSHLAGEAAKILLEDYGIRLLVADGVALSHEAEKILSQYPPKPILPQLDIPRVKPSFVSLDEYQETRRLRTKGTGHHKSMFVTIRIGSKSIRVHREVADALRRSNIGE